jgi:hypothetical protein
MTDRPTDAAKRREDEADVAKTPYAKPKLTKLGLLRRITAFTF